MTLWTEPAVGQWFVSNDGVRWWFDSGDISLDFAYTGSMGDGRPEWEYWHSPEDAEAWVLARFGVPVSVTQADLRSAKRLRDAVAGLAREAVHVLGQHADGIRECGGDNCAIVYLDTSRSANRRWCSMSRCGNRHKVRESRARQAAARSTTEPGTDRPDPTGEPE
jgi:predicted RNA-binding Zn ribbon-like protein